MNEDRIAEIRARHERDNRYGDGLYPGAHKDRAWLLAEIERQRAEMLELAEWCEAEEPLSHKKLSYRLRYALEAKP